MTPPTITIMSSRPNLLSSSKTWGTKVLCPAAKEETPKQTKAKKKPKVKKQQEAKKEEESTEESPSVSEAVAKEDAKVSGEASNPLKTNED